MRRLDQVLFTIDDGQSTVLVPSANVTSGEPTTLFESLRSQLWSLVVASSDARTTDPDLTTWARLVVNAVTLGEHVDQLDLCNGLGR